MIYNGRERELRDRHICLKPLLKIQKRRRFCFIKSYMIKFRTAKSPKYRNDS